MVNTADTTTSPAGIPNYEFQMTSGLDLRTPPEPRQNSVQTPTPTDVAGAQVPPQTHELWSKPIAIDLWARFKPKSRFYANHLDSAGQPKFFPVEALFADQFEAQDKNGKNVRFNENNYPLRACELFVCAHGKMHRLK